MQPLPNYQLAVIAQRLLLENGGFTLDEFGNSITGDLWAVSVWGMERKYLHLPSLQKIEAYLGRHGAGFGPAYFGGWKDDKGVFYLDHTLTFQHKHTAVMEAQRNHQKVIFHLGTKELLVIEEAPPVSAPDQTEEQARKEIVRQLCDEYGPCAIWADIKEWKSQFSA